jgi:hypothetical protein
MFCHQALDWVDKYSSAIERPAIAFDDPHDHKDPSRLAYLFNTTYRWRRDLNGRSMILQEFVPALRQTISYDTGESRPFRVTPDA